jgi:hypothetical protein
MIVSMFFRLDQDNASVRPIEFYREHIRKVLEMSFPMTLFCDEETRPMLESLRGDRPTNYVVKPLMEYDYVRDLIPIIRSNREGRQCYVNHRNTPLYFMLCMFKIYAIYRTSVLFPSPFYMWLDLGANHVVRGVTEESVGKIVSNPRPKIAYCYIHYRSKRELYPPEVYLQNGGLCGIAGGVFTIEHAYVPKFYSKMFSVAHDHIARGLGHSDEQCVTYVYDQHPEWFSLYFGDYYSLITNYHKTVEDKESVRHFFIANAERDSRPDLADLARKSLE